MPLILDTHVVIHWLAGSSRLSKEQVRTIAKAEASAEPLGISAVTLIEIALLSELGRLQTSISLNELLSALEQPPFRLLPVTPQVAYDVFNLRILKDPFDRTIAATARVHGFRLVTSDQRIIESNLISTIE